MMLLTQRIMRLGCLFLGVAVTGCGPQLNSEAVQLVGNWHLVEGEELEERISSGSPDDRSRQINDQSDPRMILSFRSDGSLETRSRIGAIDSTKLGTWRLLDSKVSKQELAIECQLNGQTTSHDIKFLDRHTILLIPPNLAGLTNKLTFRRTE